MTACDALVVGAGLSGLAAAVRLAHFGRSVVVAERHGVPGGLNSYYTRFGQTLDVGLHALTNFAPAGARGAPLTKLLRQLRLRREELDLVEQSHSLIRFPSATLVFDNDPQTLRASVAEAFPAEADAFDRVERELAEADLFSLAPATGSARQFLEERIGEPLLREMLLAPLLYYGSPHEDDLDLPGMVVLWHSLYREGFARPRGGVRPLLERLRARLAEAGGELRLGAGIERLEVADGRVGTAVLDGGETLRPGQVYSCAGAPETRALLAPPPARETAGLSPRTGRLSFVEWIGLLGSSARGAGAEEAIAFVSEADRFAYRRPEGLLSTENFVLCLPENYDDGGPPAVRAVRATARASYPLWAGLEKDAYREAKREAADALAAAVERMHPGLRGAVERSDLFTPCTIERFTGRREGAVYGSPDKARDGRTGLENLFLVGTDQGFLGIVGSLLSGITIANRYGLR